MQTSFNFLDALLALVVLAGVIGGWRRGFWVGALGLVVLAGSLLLAFWVYPLVAHEVQVRWWANNPWVPPMTFLGSFVVLRVLLGAVANALARAMPAKAQAHPLNRALGIFPGFIDGLLLAMIATVLLLALPLPGTVAAQTRDSEIVARLSVPGEWLEAKITPIFQDALSKTLNPRTVTPGSNESVPLAFTVPDAKPRPDLEAQMLQMVNEARAVEGLHPLRPDPELTEVARAHSRDMFARGYFSHVSPEGKDPFDRLKQAQVPYRTAGENLALAPTLALAHQGLMNSPGHRANILRPAFGRVGIGIVDGGRRGQMVTQEFRN